MGKEIDKHIHSPIRPLSDTPFLTLPFKHEPWYTNLNPHNIGAINWIEQNENDPDIDQPYMVRKADTIPKKVLSAEEKAQRLEEMKAKIQHRREEKSKIEKAAAIKSEKDRRERGQVLQVIPFYPFLPYHP